MDEIATRLKKRLDALKGARQVHESVWRDCYDHTYPQRGSGLTSDHLDAQSAKSRVALLLTSTATDSARILASALMSGMTPPQVQWMDLGEEGMSDDERAGFTHQRIARHLVAAKSTVMYGKNASEPRYSDGERLIRRRFWLFR
ncbi:portal protein [Erwinia psidii]|uniref:Uncharacterized protein n=1 Tax=Erwinia psidii TaxID=69224 RepID=A0A3N6SD69_9GAMM|nr:portal protein [Erwinia psidii]MCX8956404.1 hypothetical protein [Erwinia psidii]MCX8959838.1 hypothetical protein [Erwinia psidii]MCX8966469.1 hypothetical protein [Erwinia psidii]RQM36541.1 hypothetical protein EB241_19675 [Erwinia psidii]